MAVDARTAQYSSDKNPLGEVNGHVGGLYYCATCDISVTTAQLLHKVGTTTWDYHMGLPHGTTTWDYHMGLPHGTTTWDYHMGLPHGTTTWDYHIGLPHGTTTMTIT